MIKTAIFFLLAVGTSLCLAEQRYRQGRIVGGQNLTDDENYPFMVSIRYLNYDSHSCGGSIISKRTVLTAAHCVNHTKTENVAVIAGTNYWNKGGTRYRAQALITHPGYDTSVTSNDVGLVIVNREFIYTPTVQPIQFSSESIGEVASFYIGWGLTTDRGQLSEVLKYLDVKTVTNEECASRMGEGASYIFESSLCTMSEPEEGVCNSDSGGPLVYDNKVIGLVSWGTSKCAEGYPDVNARVSSYAAWIQSNLVD